MAPTISEQAYGELALNEYKTKWELWDGVLVAKPPMSVWHNWVATYLGACLANQLDRRELVINVNGGRARHMACYYLVPDLIVIPAAYKPLFTDDPYTLGAYADPLPFVAEVWAPASDDYDIAAKLPIYRERGDLEIWFYHPYKRALILWRKQPDGSHTEERYTSGVVPIHSLHGVTIDLDALPGGRNRTPQP
jgi:Uma2 family endonuclease